jgi:hypothetical protein
VQYADGRVRTEITIHQLHGDYPFAAAQAREVARALIAAADEVDELAGVGDE